MGQAGGRRQVQTNRWKRSKLDADGGIRTQWGRGAHRWKMWWLLTKPGRWLIGKCLGSGAIVVGLGGVDSWWDKAQSVSRRVGKVYLVVAKKWLESGKNAKTQLTNHKLFLNTIKIYMFLVGT